MPEAYVVDTLQAVDSTQWDACFPGRLEDHAYLSAVEEAGLPGFDLRYVLVEEGGKVVACAPGFITDYPLATTFTAAGRRLVGAARRLVPKAFTLRLASLGSPCAEDVASALGAAVEARARRGAAAEARRSSSGEPADQCPEASSAQNLLCCVSPFTLSFNFVGAGQQRVRCPIDHDVRQFKFQF